MQNNFYFENCSDGNSRYMFFFEKSSPGISSRAWSVVFMHNVMNPCLRYHPLLPLFRLFNFG